MKRVAISHSLIDELSNYLAAGQHCTLIAPQRGGKSDVTRRVSERLNQRSMILVSFQFQKAERVEVESDAFACLEEFPAEFSRPRSFAELSSSLASIPAASRHLVLILDHLHLVDRDLAKRFVQSAVIASTSNIHNCSLFVTTDVWLIDLFPNQQSKMEPPQVFLLQGYDLECFAEILLSQQDRFPVFFAADVQTKWLWELTGGSPYLTFELLWAYFYESALAGGIVATSLLRSDQVKKMASKLTRPGLEECPLFRVLAEELAVQTKYLGPLGRLIKDGIAYCEADYEFTAHPLELRGVARYDSGSLVFSSELMSHFIRAEFSPIHLGYLYAMADEREEAFYWLSSDNTNRGETLTSKERRMNEQIIRRLKEALLTASEEELDSLFEKSLRCLVAAEDLLVTIERRPFKSDQDRPPVDRSVGFEVATEMLCGEINVRLRGKAVPCLNDQVTIKTLLDTYESAVRAIRTTREEVMLGQLRRALSEVAGKALASIRTQGVSVADLLRYTSVQLLNEDVIGSVQVWLLSKDKTELYHLTPPDVPSEDWPIQLGDAPDHLADEFAQNLSILQSGLQNVLVKQSKWLQERNPSSYFVLLKDLDTNLGLLSITLKDSRSPTEGERLELETFGQQLNVAVSQARSLDRVNRAVNCIEEPIIVLDQAGDLVFVNSAAYSIGAANANGGDSTTAPNILDEFVSGIKIAMAGKRYVDFPNRVAERTYEGSVVYEPLMEKHGELIGLLVHIQQRSHYSDVVRVMRALDQAHDEKDALKKLVAVFQSFGHGWVRVYRAEDDRLIPEYCIDPKREDIARDFKRVELPERANCLTWDAIQTAEPQVFSYAPNLKTGEKFYTRRGLLVIADPKPPCSLELGKKPGDYWIDFPLVKRPDVIGKMTLQCDENLSPERFRMMKLLCEVCGDTLVMIGRQKDLAHRGLRIAEQRIRESRGLLLERLGPLEILRRVIVNAFGDAVIADRTVDDYCSLFDRGLANLRIAITELGADSELKDGVDPL